MGHGKRRWRLEFLYVLAHRPPEKIRSGQLCPRREALCWDCRTPFSWWSLPGAYQKRHCRLKQFCWSLVLCDHPSEKMSRSKTRNSSRRHVAEADYNNLLPEDGSEEDLPVHVDALDEDGTYQSEEKVEEEPEYHQDDNGRSEGEEAVPSLHAARGPPSLQVAHRLLTSSPTDVGIHMSVPQKNMASGSFYIHIPRGPGSSWKMMLKDGLGLWKGSKGPRSIFVRKEHNGPLVVATAISQKDYEREGDTYFFHRRCYVNQSCQTYHRVIICSADERCDFGYVHYYFRDGVERQFSITTPGRNLSDHISFSAPVKRLKVEHPRPSYVQYPPNDCGMESVTSSAEPVVVVPKSSLPDGLDEIAAKCAQESKTAEAFILKVVLAPSTRIILASKRQLTDVRRFCTNAGKFCILSKDVIPNLAESGYCLTFTIYEHLLVRTKDGRHPYILGPMCLHQNADFSSFYEFAASFIENDVNLREMVAVGPSATQDLESAFQVVFPNAMRQTPLQAIETSVQLKLGEFDVTGTEAETILQDIKEIISQMESTSDLDDRAFRLMDEWQSLHHNGTEFGQFFLSSIVTHLRQNLLLKERSHGGTPEAHALKACSVLKALIRNACGPKCSLSELVRKLKELAWRQEKELEGTVTGKSELKLDPNFSSLLCPDFFSAAKTPVAMRRSILSRIHDCSFP